jgi:hypothetical protein
MLAIFLEDPCPITRPAARRSPCLFCCRGPYWGASPPPLPSPHLLSWACHGGRALAFGAPRRGPTAPHTSVGPRPRLPRRSSPNPSSSAPPTPPPVPAPRRAKGMCSAPPAPARRGARRRHGALAHRYGERLKWPADSWAPAGAKARAAHSCVLRSSRWPRRAAPKTRPPGTPPLGAAGAAGRGGGRAEAARALYPDPAPRPRGGAERAQARPAARLPAGTLRTEGPEPALARLGSCPPPRPCPFRRIGPTLCIPPTPFCHAHAPPRPPWGPRLGTLDASPGAPGGLRRGAAVNQLSAARQLCPCPPASAGGETGGLADRRGSSGAAAVEAAAVAPSGGTVSGPVAARRRRPKAASLERRAAA